MATLLCQEALNPPTDSQRRPLSEVAKDSRIPVVDRISDMIVHSFQDTVVVQQENGNDLGAGNTCTNEQHPNPRSEDGQGTETSQEEEQRKRFLAYATKAIKIKGLLFIRVLATIAPQLFIDLPNMVEITVCVISILPDLGFLGKDQRRGINSMDTLCWVLSFFLTMIMTAFQFCRQLVSSSIYYGIPLLLVLLVIIIAFFSIGFPNGITSRALEGLEAQESDLNFAFKLSADITASSWAGLTALTLTDKYFSIKPVFRYYELLSFFVVTIGPLVTFLASVRPTCGKLVTGLKYTAYSSVLLQVLAQIVAFWEFLGMYILLPLIIGGWQLVFLGILRCFCNIADSIICEEYEEYLSGILYIYSAILSAIYSVFSGKKNISIWWKALPFLTLSASISILSILSILMLIDCKLPQKIWAEKVLKFSRSFNQMVVLSPLIYLLLLLFMTRLGPSTV